MEVQAVRRKITHVIMDQTMLDVIKEESSHTTDSNGDGDNGEGRADIGHLIMYFFIFIRIT